MFLGEAFLTFDGAVVESFGLTESANGRVHLAVLRQVEVGESRRGGHLQLHTVWGGSPVLVPFPPEQKQAAQWFADQVEQARAARQG
jgi:hypothetical protein